MENTKLIIQGAKLRLVLLRLAQQLIENDDSGHLVLIGIQPRGVILSRHIYNILSTDLGFKALSLGELDPTFFRDDLHTRREMILPHQTVLNVSIENKRVVLVDDVLYTGRTVRAAIESLLSYGRPKKIELLCLVNRRFSRHIPVSPDYVGLEVDTVLSQSVKVQLDSNMDKASVVII